MALGPSICVVSGLHAHSSFVRCSCRFIGKYWCNFPHVLFQSHACVVGVLSACRRLRANLLSSVFGAVCLLLSAFHMAAPYFVSFLVALLTSDSMFERGFGAYVSKPRLC